VVIFGSKPIIGIDETGGTEHVVDWPTKRGRVKACFCMTERGEPKKGIYTFY
jgi:hypothetical protein